MFFKFIWPAILWGAFITFVSLLPGKDMPDVGIVNFDKAAHFGVYALWSFLLIVGFRRQSGSRWWRENALITAILGTALYGMILEVIQGTCYEDRYFSFWDAFFNAAGSLGGAWAANWIKIKTN